MRTKIIPRVGAQRPSLTYSDVRDALSRCASAFRGSPLTSSMTWRRTSFRGQSAKSDSLLFASSAEVAELVSCVYQELVLLLEDHEGKRTTKRERRREIISDELDSV